MARSDSRRAGDDEKRRIGEGRGPYDFDELATPAAELENSHLDLGSVLVPVVEGGQVTVEMSGEHQPEAVYLITPSGRIGVAAFAAPKSPGLWREVVRELAEALRDAGASTAISDGFWGREVVAEAGEVTYRYVGVDGPRWMVRCEAAGPTETADELAQLARAVLAESIVRRGTEPFPPRDPLPVVLPPVIAEQVAAAQQEMFGDAEGGESAAQAPTPSDESGEVVAGGALDQVAQATIVTDPGDEVAAEESTAEESADPDAARVDEDEAADEPGSAVDPHARSAGSAMQRFRQRRKR